MARSPWRHPAPDQRPPLVQTPSNSGLHFDDLDVCAAEFGRVPALDGAAELLAKRLLAVADGENRNPAREDRFGRARAPRFRNRGRAAGKDHRLGSKTAKASAARENGWISQ